MKLITTLILFFTLTACGSAPDKSQDFDAYLEQLMAEPYDPENGSKF